MDDLSISKKKLAKDIHRILWTELKWCLSLTVGGFWNWTKCLIQFFKISGYINLKVFKAYLFVRESEHGERGGGPKGERESPKHTLLNAEYNTGLNCMTLRPEPKLRIKHLTGWATQTPLYLRFLMRKWFSDNWVVCPSKKDAVQ